jgi:hypothetical protein
MIQISALVDRYRSYHGFVCWLLVGIGGDGYIVDAQALRDRLKSWRMWASNEQRKVVLGGAKTLAVIEREFGIRYYTTMAGGESSEDEIDWRQRPFNGELRQKIESTAYALFHGSMTSLTG